MVGRRLRHVDVLETIGEGGTGVVCRSRDTHLDRLVALKILPPEKVPGADRKRRCIEGTRAAFATDHSDIVISYDIGQADGIDVIAMDCVPGEMLDPLIPRTGTRMEHRIEARPDRLTLAPREAREHHDIPCPACE
jgi:serine/threonine-protein kinase